MKTTHYVYKIVCNKQIDERKFYIGVRSCNTKPAEDKNYWSSSNSLKVLINEIGIDSFSKEILSTWNTREEAVEEEIRLHDLLDIGRNKEYFNKAKQRKNGFDRTGMVTAFNTITNSYCSVTKEYFKENEFLIGGGKNTVAVKHKITGVTKRIPKELFDKSQEWVSANLENTKRGAEINTAKKIKIYDSKGNIKFETYGNFNKVCDENNLPKIALGNSYRNNGVPLYQDLPKNKIVQLSNQGFYKFKGWYAKKVKT